MTKKLEQAARQALEALEVSTDWDVGARGKQLQSMKAITALREALAEQAEQEPFAWMHPSGGCLSAHYMKEFATGLEKETHTIPLYAAPVSAKAIRSEALEEAAKVCRTAQAKGLQSIREAIEAAIRGLK